MFPFLFLDDLILYLLSPDFDHYYWIGQCDLTGNQRRSFDRQISRYIEYISRKEDIGKIRLTEENSMKLFGFLFPCIAPALSVTLFQSVEVELSRLE